MANELSKTIETNEEIITVTLDKKLVTKFDNAFKKAGSSMRDMCIIAWQITHDDKDAQDLFRHHVEKDLGMSKATASKLISTGSIYNNYPDTQCLAHTKCAELLPVRDKVDTFLDSIEMDANELNTLSQRVRREKVKSYLNPTTEDATESTTEDATESTEEVQDTQDTQDTEEKVTEPDEKDVRIGLLEERVKYLYNLTKVAVLGFKAITKEYELDEKTEKNITTLINDLGKATIKDLGL